MKTIENIPLKDKDRESIKEAIDILRQKFPIERILLFGSKAKGTDDEESEVVTGWLFPSATKLREMVLQPEPK